MSGLNRSLNGVYSRRLQRTLIFIAAAGVAFGQAPRIFSRAIFNAASFAPAGVPGGSIAQGSMLSIFGTNLGPAKGVPASSFPLQTSLSGVSLTFTEGGQSVNLIPLYVSAGQINAIMPSNAGIGLGSLQVTYNNLKSNFSPMQVVASSFGIFAVGGSGMGPGAVHNFVTQANQPLNSLQTTAAPGDTVTIYGTGLGPITAPDNVAPPAGSLPVTVEAWVGGQTASVAYSGRSPCCSGLDQIVLNIPKNVPQGCWVPIYFRTAGAVTSNAVTVAIDPKRAPCSDPNNPLTHIFTTGGTGGTLRLTKSSVHEDVATLAPVDAATDMFTYDLRNLPGGPFVFSPLLSQPPAGSCTVFEFAGDYWGLNGGFPSPLVQVSYLDTGTFTASGSVSGDLAPAVSGGFGAFLGSNLSPYFPSQLTINPGTAKLTSNGGTDVPSFSSTITIPQPFTWTGRDELTTIPRSQPLTLSWTGLPSGQQMSILGGNVDLPSNSSALFYCVAPVGASSFVIPNAVLEFVPATRADLRASKGLLYLVNSSPGNGIPVHASGIKTAVALAVYMFGKTVIFQ